MNLPDPAAFQIIPGQAQEQSPILTVIYFKIIGILMFGFQLLLK